MKFTQLFIFFAVAMFVTLPIHGQKYLQKSYNDWTIDEAKKVLHDSPWAKEYQSERGLANLTMQQQAREAADNRLDGLYRGNSGRAAAPLPVVMRLHSSLPVRQAMVRLQQIGANYDKMSAEEKKKFDESANKFIACAICKDYYVVTIAKFKNSGSSVDDGIFQDMKLADFKGKVWLVNDKKERLELTEFTAAKKTGDSSVFFFKRNNEKGTPFFSAEDKTITFLFAEELRDTDSSYSILIPSSFEFKVGKMLVDGKLEF